MKWLVGLLDRGFAVVGVLLLAQAPLFLQQYTTQLSGRLAELRLQVNGMAQAASQGKKSVPQYIQRFIESGDPDFVRQGDLMNWTLERQEEFTASLQALSSSTLFSKPFVFVRHANVEVIKSTLSEFQPGLPLTLEGGVYALIGLAIGCGIFYWLRAMARYFRYLILNALRQ